MQNKIIAAAVGLPLLAGAVFLTGSNAPAANEAKPAHATLADCCNTSDPDCCPAGNATYPATKPVAAKTAGCCAGDPCCH